jgi:clan AA aspartic protease (TIGR02281 family)
MVQERHVPPKPKVALALASTPRSLRTEIPLESDGGTFRIPVTINDAISLKFTIDSGASDVTIPSDVASTLVRAGTISADDYVGSQTFTLADGSEVPSPEFRIRSLRVGNVVLHDVIASITGTNGNLLLGQTFLRQLKSWSIDNSRHVLLLEAGTEATAVIAGTLPTTVASSISGKLPEPQDSSLAASSEYRVRNYFAAWSDPDDPDGLSVGQYYGDPVSFYGKQLTLNDLMSQEKLPFARRWPIRSYTPEQNSMRTQCSPQSRSCTVSGIVSWAVSNPARMRRSSGTARFSLLLVDGRIVGEGGRVLSRH